MLVDQKKLTVNPLDTMWAPGPTLSTFVWDSCIYLIFLCYADAGTQGMFC